MQRSAFFVLFLVLPGSVETQGEVTPFESASQSIRSYFQGYKIITRVMSRFMNHGVGLLIF